MMRVSSRNSVVALGLLCGVMGAVTPAGAQTADAPAATTQAQPASSETPAETPASADQPVEAPGLAADPAATSPTATPATEAPAAVNMPAADAVNSEEEPGWSRSRMGVAFGLLGVDSTVHLGFAWQPSRWIDVMVLGGYNTASAAGNTGVSSANASIDIISGTARGRFWLLQRHSPIAEVGFGVSHFGMKANGHGTLSGNAADSISYTRSGASVTSHAGLGYGFRTSSSFRISVSMGAVFHLTTPGPGSASSSGSFTEQDEADLRTTLDSAVDSLFDPRPYIDLTAGFLF